MTILNSNMWKNKENRFIIYVIAMILAIISMFAFLYLRQRPLNTTQGALAISPSPTIDPIEEAQTVPPIAYKETSMDTIVEKVDTRPALSPTDAAAKEKIISLLPIGQRYGIVYETANIRIDYTTSADLIQVEILTSDVTIAKIEGNTWFLKQGMSQQGVCDLPVMYYLNWDLAQSLRDQGLTFDPLPLGC